MSVSCTDCPRCKTRNKPTAPEVHHYRGRDKQKGIKVFILGESPGTEEDLAGRPFVGRTGTVILRPLLKGDIEEYILDNSVRCFSPSKPKPEHIKACSKHWKAEVEKHRPDVIVALGNYAAEAVLGRKIKITDQVGNAVSLHVGNRKYPVLLNFHPAYILRQRGKKGGEYERINNSWLNTWDAIPDLVERGVDEAPETHSMTDVDEIVEFLKKVKRDYSAVSGKSFTYDYEAWGDRGALRPDICNKYAILSVGVGLGEPEREVGVSFPFDTCVFAKSGECTRIIKADKRVEKLWRQTIAVPGRVAQNAKYEHKANIKRFGFTEYLRDTMLAMNTIHELSRADLGSIATYCKIPWAAYKLLMKEVQEKPESVPLPKLLRYSGLDGLATHISWHRLLNQIADSSRERILAMREQFALYLAMSEMNGMHINRSSVAETKRTLKRELLRAEAKFRDTSEVRKTEKWAVKNIKSFKEGDHFNPRSPVQMKYLCINLLKLPVKPSKYKWKDGKRVAGTISLAKDVLENFEENYPVVKWLNKVRSINSMFSGFLDKWEKYVCGNDCVHTNYTQTIVVTGRLSSTDPNLQNIPTDSPVRRVFNSRYDDGYVIAPDYSQLEPRILAGWSGDKEMCRALNDGLDLHRFVGAIVYDTDYDSVTSRQRWIAKRRNLGSMYGQTAEGLADMCNISLDEAKEIVAIYDAKFPGVYQFRLSKHKEAMKYGIVKDLFGAVRHLPDAQHGTRVEQERAFRQAGNFPIQSTGNTFHLIALCVLFRLFNKYNIKASVMGPEHDKIYVDSSGNHLERSFKYIKDAMLIHNERDYWVDKPVKMKVDFKYGKNLYEMESVEVA